MSFVLQSTGSTPITWSKVSGPSTITLDSSGTFHWTPGVAGEYVIVIQASNAHGTDTDDFIATAVPGSNVPPIIVHPGNQTVQAQERLSLVVVSTDSDGDPLAYSLTASAPAGTFIDPNTGQFIWTPTGEQGPASYPIVVSVTDGQNESLSTFTVTVNDAIWTRIGGSSTQLGRTNDSGNVFLRI
jgi:hypothetical protein